MSFRASVVAVMAAAGLVAGCASIDSPGVYDPPPRVAQRTEYGVVERIDLFREGQSQPAGLGAILGGIAGGVLGHQVGGGTGNAVATVAGAVGGALLGNRMESAHARDRYRVTVRLDDGTRLDVTEVGEGELRVGDRVRVVNNRVSRG